MPIARVQTVLTGLGGAPYLSTMYFDPTFGQPNDWTAAVLEFWTSLRTQLSSSLQVSVQSDIALMSEVTGEIGAIVIGAAGTTTGTATGDALPLSTQGLIQWRSGVYSGGREVRGRTFVPGFTEASSGAGVPTTDARNYMRIAAEGLTSAENALLVIWSRSKGVAATANGVTVWNQWAVLRSRRD